MLSGFETLSENNKVYHNCKYFITLKSGQSLISPDSLMTRLFCFCFSTGFSRGQGTDNFKLLLQGQLFKPS